MSIDAIVLDLDGVIRHFDPGHRPSVEERHGLRLGILAEAAWDPKLNRPAITGKITRAQWVAAVGAAVGSPRAAEEWLGHPGSVDHGMVALVVELRSRGLSVSVLTNGTDTVPDELAHHGIAELFDRVFNSWELGAAKPAHRVYRRVCLALDTEPQRVFFTDDRELNVVGAREVGLQAHLFDGIEGLRARLSDLLG
ncbi:MAG: HAD hydrolase-like protein [Acidimicrobiia bacterium]|nr:HAD hydrolase-like protein [Acidimicrobiia bacterium]MDH5237656.1 HAD hydrolase-like protein [Acidimicrobiia bacterium]